MALITCQDANSAACEGQVRSSHAGDGTLLAHNALQVGGCVLAEEPIGVGEEGQAKSPSAVFETRCFLGSGLDGAGGGGFV